MARRMPNMLPPADGGLPSLEVLPPLTPPGTAPCSRDILDSRNVFDSSDIFGSRDSLESRRGAPQRAGVRLPPPRASEGTWHAEYQLTDEVLGDGMNGNVMLGVDRRTGKKVAVKTYSLRGMGRQALKDMLREVTVQASLQHPNVAQLECVCRDREHIYVLVEHLGGGEVFEHLAEETVFGEGRAGWVVAQLLSAVEHLHAEGLVHRDIKLQNMMYTGADRDEVKLIDFGFCTHWEAGFRELTRVCGTDGYMAPEVEAREGYTSKADVWSVGVVAHVLLTGEMIGRRRDWTPVFSKKLAKCSMKAQMFVATLLTVDPAARPTARRALAHEFLLANGAPLELGGSNRSTAHHSQTAFLSSAVFSKAFLEVKRHPSARAKRGDFSSVCPSPEPGSGRQERKPERRRSIWRALPSVVPSLRALPSVVPSLRVLAGESLGAVLGAVRRSGFRGRGSTRVSVG